MINQKLCQDAIAFTEKLAEQYFVQRELDSLTQYMNEKISWIGSGVDEVSRNIKEAQRALARELKECGSAFTIAAHQFEALPLSDAFCVVYGDLRIVPEDITLVEEKIRISLVLEKTGSDMKLLHLHLSHADRDQEEGRFYVSKTAQNDAKSLRLTLDSHSRQLENLTRNIPGGAHRCKNDKDFTLLSMSDGFFIMFGYTRKEIHDLFHDSFLEMIHPDDRAEMLRSAQKQLEYGRDIELEYRVLRKDGAPVWVLDKGRLLENGEGDTCFYCLLMEITERKREQEELRLSLERHQVIMDQATDIIFEWDITADTLSFSPNWRKKFGYDAIDTKISGRIPLSQNIHPDDIPAFVKIMSDTAAGTPYSETEFRIKNLTGRYYWCRIRATAQFDSAHRAIKAVGVIVDIDGEKKEKQTLLDMAQKDALTGLYNKAAINALVERRMEKMDPNSMQALFILDVDHFKKVNDIYGHLCGDSVLSDVATVLKAHVRASDLVGRIGGDEFLIYLPEVANETVVQQKAEELRAAITLLTPEIGAPPLTCSIGIAVAPHGGISYETLYKNADLALYYQKNYGRDGVTFYDATLCGASPVESRVTEMDSEMEDGRVANHMAQYCFRSLYAAHDIESALRRLLEIIGRSYDVSRAYIFEDSEDGQRCSNTFEWCAEGIMPQIAKLQDLSYIDDLDNYKKNFDESGLFYLSDVRETPTNLKSVLEPQGIRSMLQCAILNEGKFVGYIGFDECRNYRAWSAKQAESFKLTADVLSVFLVQLRQKSQIARLQKQPEKSDEQGKDCVFKSI